jgi:cobalt ECF transporter T component CbiQ
MNLPEWYSTDTDGNSHAADVRTNRNPLSVRKVLANIGEVLAGELSGANRVESWLSDIEPRAKIIGILVMVFGVTLLKDLLPLAILLCLTVMLAVSSKLTLRRMVRLWLGVPLFSAAFILPAVLNIVTPGSAALTLRQFGENAWLGAWHLPSSLTVTSPGLVIAARFILRSIDCITLAAILVSSTESSVMINALRRMGMPRVFGMTLAMMQRYMALILRTAEEIHLAKISRTISSKSVRNEQRWVAAGIGTLFGRTHRLAEEVRQAMVSRGYDGDLQLGSVPSLRLPDFIWIAGVFLVMTGVLLADRLL